LLGTVRDRGQDRPATSLDYSAHTEGERHLHQVAERVVDDFPVHALAAVHRVGVLRSLTSP
jgi:molybdopterin synthase catalytic subunit